MCAPFIILISNPKFILRRGPEWVLMKKSIQNLAHVEASEKNPGRSLALAKEPNLNQTWSNSEIQYLRTAQS